MKNGRFWPPYHLSRSVHEGGDNCDARDGAAKTWLLGLRGTRTRLRRCLAGLVMFTPATAVLPHCQPLTNRHFDEPATWIVSIGGRETLRPAARQEPEVPRGVDDQQEVVR